MLSSIFFPLRTNIKSFQRWGDTYDISRRIKQSMILYDEIVIEAGTYQYTGSDRFVLQDYRSWDQRSREDVLKSTEEIETRSGKNYITVLDGKTGAEKFKYAVKKKDEFIADYRTVDVVSEIDSGSYGKEADFLKYAFIKRKENHREVIVRNTLKDLSNKKFAEMARKIYGNIPLTALLGNLNDSLVLSHWSKMPVAVDEMHTPLLRIKNEYEIGFEFNILDRLAQTAIPDFSALSVDNLLKLRKDTAIKSFREMTGKINSRLQSGDTSNIDKMYNQELLNEVAEIAPTKKKFAINIALGALSFVPVPSISIATKIARVGKGIKEYEDFATNWLSFVLKARKLERR